jgi:alpha-1,2-mannosyltransferase
VNRPSQTERSQTEKSQAENPGRIASFASWLTPRRLRAQAIVLALCTWAVFAFDFSAPGFFDRAGNIKFQDFLPLYVSARVIAEGHTGDLYNESAIASNIQTITGTPARVRLPNLYGPQMGLAFVSLAHFSFPAAARIWVALSLLGYILCIWLIWKSCLALRPHWAIVTVSAFAFPPVFHFFVRGQISALVLACFAAAYLAFRAERNWLAGLALGLLVFKPQFLVAIPLVLLLAGAWRAFVGLALSATTQLTLAWMYFGSTVMRSYFETLWHVSRWIGAAELNLAPIQMHSLRSFWTLLIPWPQLAFALYIFTSLAIIVVAAAVWKSTSSLSLRFSALTLAAVLVNPHLFVYDLLVLAPVLLLVIEWTLTHASSTSASALRVLAYLAFVLPLLGPLSRWTHLQLSVPVFVVLLWMIWRRCSPTLSSNLDRQLAPNQSRVV